MLARIGVMKPLNGHVERMFIPIAKRHIGEAEEGQVVIWFTTRALRKMIA